MKILVVALQFPYPARSGVNMRVSQLMKQAARRHDVVLLSYARPDQAEAVAELRMEFPVHVVTRPEPSTLARRTAQLRSVASSQSFAARDFYCEEMQRAIHDICAAEGVDLIQLEGALLCSFATPGGIPVVLDEHNIDYEVFERMCESERSLLRRTFHRVEYRRFRRFEEQAWRRVAGCAVTSEREVPIVRAAAPANTTAVVPNGVDLEYFTAADEHDALPCSLVFNGTLDYRPNVDAAQHLVNDVWPLIRERCPDATLNIVGRAPEAEARRLRRPGVTVTGEVPDLRPYLRRAAVIGVPVRMGGGTRLKVVEGLALGKAMVSTTLGCEGVGVRDGEHLLIGDGPEAFADRVLELFDDAERRERLGRAGRRLMEQRYSWDLAGERLDALYRRVGPERAGRTDGVREPAARGDLVTTNPRWA
jgi:polysaccharide biosynthesis protein PslH